MNQILNQILNWISFPFYTASQHFGKRGLTVFWSHHSTSVLNKLHRSICLFSFSYLVHGFGWPAGCLSCPRVRGGTEASGKLHRKEDSELGASCCEAMVLTIMLPASSVQQHLCLFWDPSLHKAARFRRFMPSDAYPSNMNTKDLKWFYLNGVCRVLPSWCRLWGVPALLRPHRKIPLGLRCQTLAPLPPGWWQSSYSPLNNNTKQLCKYFPKLGEEVARCGMGTLHWCACFRCLFVFKYFPSAT